jgi:serine/threonine protein phosphatase PrpC
MKYINRFLTDVGRVRSANEDSLGEAITPNGHLFVVCDGMGGHVGGAVASSKAVESLIEFFQKDTYDNPIQALDHALSFANEQLYAATMVQPELKGMGTTAVVVLIRNEECFIAHVGDSRIYFFSDGKLNRLTKDHSYVQTLVDANIIADEEAENHPNKNQILQALGIAPIVKSTVCSSPVLPKKGDVFLLCSDGLNGMINDREIERLLNQNQIEEWPQILINAALEAGGKDNVTASLIEITESDNLSSTFVNFNPKSTEPLHKTREVPIDYVSQNDDYEKEKKKPIKRIYLYVGLGILLIGISILLLFLFNKPNEPEKTPIAVVEPVKTESLLTKDSIIQYLNSCDSIAIMKLNARKSNIHLDTTFKCGTFSGNFSVKDSIIKIEMLSISSNFIITDNTKLNSLSALAEAFAKNCQGVTSEKIKEYNVLNNADLTDKQKQKLKNGILDIGWKIYCPPCDVKK